MTSSSWKKGDHGDLQKDPTKPENYRPICSLSTLYKLFSTMLYNRLHAKLDSYSFFELAGFRQIQTTGHLTTYRLIAPSPLPFFSSSLPSLSLPKADNGDLSCGWRRSTFRRISIQFNMMQFGDLSEIIRVNGRGE